MWKISQLERVTTDNGVITAHWVCSDTDANGNSGSVYGSQGFEYDAASPDFIPFESLTEDTVIGWVKAAMGAETVAAHEANVAAQIEAAKAPKTAAGVPWSK